ncbi:hypothetical protein GT755_12190 [Herbidospora sp. NEAU-GS84]|uniref:Uncharacterized protein n=1 Tax=Herbidospora solisilvae TaxID=2696284 RepID=A0A7C9JC22_9ACTN|nr:hypothetical protein [Herbidospora solisilvae]NAS22441.1 hypothetical protein [Herbidospora solisilvae]
MTSSSHTVPDRFRVVIADCGPDDGPIVGITEPTRQLGQVRDQHERFLREFPHSLIEVEADGEWKTATSDELTRIAAATALSVAASLVANGELPLLNWSLHVEYDGTASLSTHVYGNHESTFRAFANFLDLVQKSEDGHYVRLNGKVGGVKVRLSASKPHTAEAAA